MAPNADGVASCHRARMICAIDTDHARPRTRSVAACYLLVDLTEPAPLVGIRDHDPSHGLAVPARRGLRRHLDDRPDVGLADRPIVVEAPHRPGGAHRVEDVHGATIGREVVRPVAAPVDVGRLVHRGLVGEEVLLGYRCRRSSWRRCWRGVRCAAILRIGLVDHLRAVRCAPSNLQVIVSPGRGARRSPCRPGAHRNGRARTARSTRRSRPPTPPDRRTSMRSRCPRRSGRPATVPR